MALPGFVQYSSIDRPSRVPANDATIGYTGTRSVKLRLYAATTWSRPVYPPLPRSASQRRFTSMYLGGSFASYSMNCVIG